MEDIAKLIISVIPPRYLIKVLFKDVEANSKLKVDMKDVATEKAEAITREARAVLVGRGQASPGPITGWRIWVRSDEIFMIVYDDEYLKLYIEFPDGLLGDSRVDW